MKDLRKLAEEIVKEHENFDLTGNYNGELFVDNAIDAMLSFHEQASKDMFTTDDMLGFAEHCRLTEVLPTYDNLDIWKLVSNIR